VSDQSFEVPSVEVVRRRGATGEKEREVIAPSCGRSIRVTSVKLLHP
jgi:hypothetical protein